VPQGSKETIKIIENCFWRNVAMDIGEVPPGTQTEITIPCPVRGNIQIEIKRNEEGVLRARCKEKSKCATFGS